MRPSCSTATSAGTAPMDRISFHGIRWEPVIVRPLSYEAGQHRSTTMAHVIILGAGHNGLVASILLARAGLEVTVLEERDAVGGACRTEYPFRCAPKLG